MIVYQPCKGVIEGSWEWWLKGCWMLPSSSVETVLVALGVGAAGALVIWAVKRFA